MTTRDHARRTAASLRAADVGRGLHAEPAPALSDRLYAARERTGVDLYRAERDTKIRARYLDALERGDYKALPGAVYTKGFLRNYALYLGLDPDEVIRDWRLERGEVREIEPIVVPRPLAAPRQGLTFSPGVVWAALLTVGVLLFAGYLGIQLMRFAKPPTLVVSQPATAILEVPESTQNYVLKGTSIPGATISVTTPGREQPYRVSADGDGNWVVEVRLRRGQNQFDISATDPETGKTAQTIAQRFIFVEFLEIEAPTLALAHPAEGATFENGAIRVEGRTTNAERVEIVAAYVGPADGPPGGPAPGSSAPAGPAPGGSPAAGPAATPQAPAPMVASLEDDGTFGASLELTAGRWGVTVTSVSRQGKTSALTRTVTVAYNGVTLAVNVDGGRAWLKVWVDGELAPGMPPGGRIVNSGETLTFTGKTSVEVRTGSSGATHFTLNGTPLGALGRSGVPETWLFEPPNPPQKSRRT
jgi:cytoskeletal protein RodZ